VPKENWFAGFVFDKIGFAVTCAVNSSRPGIRQDLAQIETAHPDIASLIGAVPAHFNFVANTTQSSLNFIKICVISIIIQKHFLDKFLGKLLIVFC